MRMAFLILLLLNLAVFVWGAGYLGKRDSGRETERLAAQLNPEAIKLFPPTPVRMCQQIEGMDSAQLASLRKHFEPRSDVEIGSSDLPAAASSSYWVAIPGLDSAELAGRKQSELNKLGINDSKIIEDARNGPFAVVIGSFTDAASAQKLLDEISPKGVRSARLVNREAPATKLRVSLKWPDSVAATRRDSLQNWLSALPAGHGLHAEACPVK